MGLDRGLTATALAVSAPGLWSWTEESLMEAVFKKAEWELGSRDLNGHSAAEVFRPEADRGTAGGVSHRFWAGCIGAQRATQGLLAAHYLEIGCVLAVSASGL